MPQDSEVRKLAAVMFTDIAGYTAMVQQDEASALKKVSTHRKHLIENTAKYQGQVIQFWGDGSLSIYESVVDAVHCAIAMQHAYAENGRVPVRIGIHFGDFVIRQDSIFGDSVNVASRIQAEGIPGSILVSGKVHAELSNHSDIDTRYLGKYTLKNVLEPVRIYAVSSQGVTVPPRNKKVIARAKKGWSVAVLVLMSLLVLALLYFKGNSSVTSDLREERIAVPEFEDLTGDPAFNPVKKMAAHWITTELIESVHATVVSYPAAVENTQVSFAQAPGRFSSLTGAVNVIQGMFRFIGTTKDSLEFSATILNLKSGMLVDVTLPRPRCTSADPMQCIMEMANGIKGVWVSRNDQVLQPPKYEAYKKYLEARAMWFDEDSRPDSLLRLCIQLDPAFIDAYFLLLDWYYNEKEFASASEMLMTMKTRFTNLTTRQRNYLLYHQSDNQGHNADAFKYFLNEYLIDPKDLFLNTSGMILASEYMHAPDKVLEFFKEINPDSLDLNTCTYCQLRYSFAIHAYKEIGKLKEARRLAEHLRKYVRGRHNYQKLIEFYVTAKDTTSANRVLEESMNQVEPPFKSFMYLIAGRQAQLRGDKQLRDRYAARAVMLAPDSSRNLARSYYLMDSLDRALAIYQQTFKNDSADYRNYAEAGVIYARKGDKAKAEQMIAQLEAMKQPFDYGNTPYAQGRIAAHLGERDRALSLLRKALDEGAKFFSSFTFHEDIDLMLLRNDAEYRKLLVRTPTG